MDYQKRTAKALEAIERHLERIANVVVATAEKPAARFGGDEYKDQLSRAQAAPRSFTHEARTAAADPSARDIISHTDAMAAQEEAETKDDRR